MNEPLLTLERALYRNVVDDGVWDTVLGAWLLAIGGSIAAGMPVVGHLVGGTAFPIGYMATRRTARRAGHVRFSAARVRRIRRARLVVPAAIVVLLFGFLAAGPRLPDLAKAALFLAGALSIGASLFDISRFHVYAIVILAAAGGVIASGRRWELTLIVAGGLILTSGLIVLTRFLRRFPSTPDALI